MATKEQAIQLTKDNLHLVFGERDVTKRLETISVKYVLSSEVLFIDPMGVYRSHQAVSDMVSKLQEMGPEDVFSEIGMYSRFHELCELGSWYLRCCSLGY
jgi:hypothetical protein